VTKRIDSDGLILVNRQLGIAGPQQSPTELDDTWVSMIMDITPSVRRARALGVVQGWFIGVMENAHAGAGALTSTIDPYIPGATAVGAGGANFPATIPQGYDVWLMSAVLARTAGGGALTSGLFSLAPAAVNQAWGIDDMGAAAAAPANFGISHWTSISNGEVGLNAAGRTFIPFNMRIPRRTTFRFFTDAAAAATYQLVLILGAFPEGLGQDIAS